MKNTKRLALTALFSAWALLPSMAATSIGVNFQGRDGVSSGNPATPPLEPTDVAGVVPQGNWNNVDNAYGYDPANTGTTGPLVDATGAATTVTLTFEANDSWYNDVDPTTITTANAKLMNGIIKANGDGVTESFTFNGLPNASYDAYVYINENGDGAQVNISDAAQINTFYVIETHQFTDASTFIQAVNTDPNGTRDVGNYVKFPSLATYGSGSIGINVLHVTGTDGSGVAGLQLVRVGNDVVNTIPPTILTEPYSRRVLVGDQVTFSVAAKGPLLTYQWFRGTTLIPGATESTYQTEPLTAADNGATYHVEVKNNVSTVPSVNAVITIGSLVQAPGLALQQYYDGATRQEVEDGTAGDPTWTATLPSFETPNNQGDNYTERVSALFSPPVTGNYVFYVSSDDDSDLFISTDSNPANKTLIAQETNWSSSRNWTGSEGGSPVTQKRSDKWVPDYAGDPTATPPFGAGIPLVAGNSYYIEGVHHEGGGGDDFGATFKLMAEPDPAVGSAPTLAGFVFAKYALTLDGATINVQTPPLNTTASQSQTATLSIVAKGGYVGDTSPAGPGIAYQWQTAPAGSSSFTDIPGAIGASYTTPILTLPGDNGRQYRVKMLAGDASSTSSTAVLAVVPDSVPPKPVAVLAVGATFKTVTVSFSELLDKTSAEVGGNYVFNPGAISGSSAVLDETGKIVTITTASALTPNANNVLTIIGVKDLAGNPVAANTTIAFYFDPVTYEENILFDNPLGYYRFSETTGQVATNTGTTGGNGAYYTGNEAGPGEGGTPADVKSAPGPRPPEFAGFTTDNNSASFPGPDAEYWVDTKNQFLSNLGAFTLEYWVQPVGRTGGDWANRVGIVGQNDAVEYGFIDPNTIQIWTPNGGSLNTTYSFPDGEWHHVATIADGTSIKTYYDGVLKGTTSATTGNYGNSAYTVHIGGGGVFDAAGNWYTGQLDEVAIFNKALSAAQVAGHYKAGKDGGVLVTSGAVTPGDSFQVTVSASGDTLTISWSPVGGTLQSSPALNGSTANWTDVGTANPATVTAGAAAAFFQVKP